MLLLVKDLSINLVKILLHSAVLLQAGYIDSAKTIRAILQ